MIIDKMNKILSCITLPGRLRRFCCKKSYRKTNCSDDMISEVNPRSIISWNIQGLFCFTTPLKVKNVIEKIRKFDSDIICLQEVFEDHIKEKIINEVKDIYPHYILGNNTKKFVVGEDSGLLVLSKYHINFKKEFLIEECVLPDYLCNKTVIYFSVGEYNFSTTHLQANNYVVAENQIWEIRNKSPFEKFIITGDLNHEKAEEILNVEKTNEKNTWDNMILDYIIPINCKNMKFDVNVIDMNLSDVTDHLPIIAKFS
jgi:exonuclease III